MVARFSSSKNKNAQIILRAGMETHPIMILLHSIYSPTQVRSLPRFKEWRNRLHPLIGVSTNNCGYFYNFPCTGYIYMENIPRTSVGNEDGNTIRMGISLKKKKKGRTSEKRGVLYPLIEKNEVGFLSSFPTLFGLKM